MFQIFRQFLTAIHWDLFLANLLFLFNIRILVESQQSFYANLTLKFFIDISIRINLILRIKILDYHWFVVVIWLAGLLVKVNALAFLLRIDDLRGMVLIYIDSVFIDWVHFETTFFKWNILEAVVDCVFFFYLKHFSFWRGLHYWVVLSVLFWNGFLTNFS